MNIIIKSNQHNQTYVPWKVDTITNIFIFRELRKTLPSKILLSLCTSLIALLTVFLVAAEKTSDKMGCLIVGALLHYFILTSFLWMAVEAVNLYRMFVKVRMRGSQTKFYVAASLVAWGKCLWSFWFLIKENNPRVGIMGFPWQH